MPNYIGGLYGANSDLSPIEVRAEVRKFGIPNAPGCRKMHSKPLRQICYFSSASDILRPVKTTRLSSPTTGRSLASPNPRWQDIAFLISKTQTCHHNCASTLTLQSLTGGDEEHAHVHILTHKRPYEWRSSTGILQWAYKSEYWYEPEYLYEAEYLTSLLRCEYKTTNTWKQKCTQLAEHDEIHKSG
ncbi:hypothetical protein HOLleu_09041 [Holothuria leucospilota]|uniref:Uncharacterized protein n=1 Tax=Holothuria leucospilota TaxID=206669 RepID=A0A9Q1CIE3_HOLLE|nr:hypothetical protein HOLleu_09041 [Holothuria leucospilota]